MPLIIQIRYGIIKLLSLSNLICAIAYINCLLSSVLFVQNTEDYLFQVILEKTIRIPRSLSVKAATVLKAFLEKKPLERLGCSRENAFLDIVNHPFFKSIDWESVSCFFPLVTRGYECVCRCRCRRQHRCQFLLCFWVHLIKNFTLESAEKRFFERIFGCSRFILKNLINGSTRSNHSKHACTRTRIHFFQFLFFLLLSFFFIQTTPQIAFVLDDCL